MKQTNFFSTYIHVVSQIFDKNFATTVASSSARHRSFNIVHRAPRRRKFFQWNAVVRLDQVNKDKHPSSRLIYILT